MSTKNQNVSDSEFFRCKEAVRSGVAFYRVQPLSPSTVIDHYVLGRTVVSHALGAKLVKWHLTPLPDVCVVVPLVFGGEVMAVRTDYTYHD